MSIVIVSIDVLALLAYGKFWRLNWGVADKLRCYECKAESKSVDLPRSHSPLPFVTFHSPSIKLRCQVLYPAACRTLGSGNWSRWKWSDAQPHTCLREPHAEDSVRSANQITTHVSWSWKETYGINLTRTHPLASTLLSSFRFIFET
jgi:hypothetical protein